MRVHGTLKKWNDDRGFGFVALPQSHEEIFVHISAFQRGGTRPCIGETISFEIRTGPDGRKRAEDVQRPGASVRDRDRRDTGSGRKRGTLGAALGVVAAIIGLGSYLDITSRDTPGEAGSTAGDFATPQQSFRCDGRTRCSDMTSCAEALYFLEHCPNAELDGDRDGEPCEGQWCN